MTSTPSRALPAEERQINLLLALRNTRVGMTAAQIVSTVSGYDPDGGAAARRMFERDKDMLRGLGIVITTTGQGEASRYSIREDDYALADITLTAGEAAAVNLAASAWRSGALTASARHALTKIRAVMPEGAASEMLVDLSVDLAGQEISPALAAAVEERRVVSFDYASASSGTTRARTVEPHRLRMSAGAWYLDALDRASGAERTFRLARVVGDISVISDPDAFRPPELPDPDRQEALVAVAPGRGLQLRQRADRVVAAEDRRAPDVSRPDPPVGWDVLAVPYDDDDRFALAGSLAALADGIVVLGPASLRRLVLDHLIGVAALAGEC